MKKGWEYSTIGELCNKINGLWKGKKEPFVNVGVIRNANFTKDFTLSFDNIEYLDVEAKQYKTRKLEKGDLIVEKSGGSEKQPVGRTILFEKEEGEYSFSNFTSVLRIKDWNVISPKFLYKYILFVYLRGDTRKMQKATTGIHNIEFDKFLSIPVPVPPLSEQQSIVDYLDSAFAKIDAMKANAEKALNEAKALFQAALKEMLEPKEGWEEKTLKDIVDDNCPISYGIVQQGNHIEGGVPVVRPVDLNKKYVTVGDLKCTTESISSSYKRTILRGDEILLGVRGTTGIVSIATKELKGCNVNRGIVPLYFKDKIYRDFIYYEMLSPTMQYVFAEKTTGSTLKQINIKDLRMIKFSYPSIENQQKIVTTLDSLKSKVDRLQENYDKISQECDALKQAILRQVFE
ncbi:MAG: restriction endonuclease subunit S [Bacteroidaceae bacterium]|nr:restriction endonuclease subunit S [Bacteroidaceae bacterium]